MRYRHPAIRSALAAEYALGTLKGAARRRFEHLLASDPVLIGEVEDWQAGLYTLIEGLPDREPPERVWHGLSQRLGLSHCRSQDSAGFWSSLAFWRTGGLLAAAAALVLALSLVVQLTRPAAVEYVVVLTDDAERAAWLVRAMGDRQLTVRSIRPQTLAAERSFELWVVPGAGGAPRSLGLIPPEGDAALQLPRDLAPGFTSASALAVSLEPTGGSPTGAPTGPVLYTGAVSIR